VRIVLDERDNVLKFERGSFIDDATRSLFVMRGDSAIRVPVELGAASVAEVEVVRGLAAGDRVIVSDMRDYDTVDEVTVTN
jgi:HlyD family secretion protein